MPVSNDNQDYKNPENKNDDKKNEADKAGAKTTEVNTKMTSDDLKGKKVDADLEQESDKPADV